MPLVPTKRGKSKLGMLESQLAEMKELHIQMLAILTAIINQQRRHVQQLENENLQLRVGAQLKRWSTPPGKP